jgi:hypothetical protein
MVRIQITQHMTAMHFRKMGRLNFEGGLEPNVVSAPRGPRYCEP